MSHAFSVSSRVAITHHSCISDLLAERARCTPNAPALLAPGRANLTYGRLHQHVNDIVQTLQAMGVGRNDRIALVLPNGPEMAVASLAVAAGAISVPLNTTYNTREFNLSLTNVRAKALIVQSGMDSPARAVAETIGIGVIELSPTLEAEAGLFTLTGEGREQTLFHGFAQPDDVAVVLQTSGTTSYPKLVPLTHSTICARAHDICIAQNLVDRDCCLNVMPLIHGHGLINTMLASLMAGGSMVCTPGFDASKFFSWMAEFHPTWYTAVPSIHQEVLKYGAMQREVIVHYPLRFIRSGTAPLPPHVLTELERMFNAPVIEIYGLTETSMITCHPMPLRERKVGSVGTTIGLEVAIMNEMGTFLSTGTTGEIVVRGSSVIQGYDNDPMANRDVFTNGWFRTGDQGYLDTDGYLFITGRLKEIINRGGEKISPCEIEEILTEHPAIAEVVAFAMPHPNLGEDVAVAIVLRENTSATASEIRKFMGARLANFKIPRQVIFVDDIPKGATGKVQRIGLAAKLGLPSLGLARSELEGNFVDPHTPLESLIAGIWQEILGVDRVGVYDNFFDLGGHSLLAVQVIARLERKLRLRVNPRELIYQNLGQLASSCEDQMHPLQSLESKGFAQKAFHALKNAIAHRTGARKWSKN